MFPDEESSEDHPDSFYQDGSYEEGDSDDTNSGKGCLIVIAIILILSLILRYLQ